MSSDTFANLVKSSTVSIPLEEYLKLEPYIKQLKDTIERQNTRLEQVHDILSLKDENKRLKDTIDGYYSRELWDGHLRGITELWYFSQTGVYLRQCGVLGKLQRLTSKIKSSIDDDTMYDEYGCGDIYQELADEGPFCVKDCTDIDAFCEKVLHCFESESFRKSYGFPPK